MKDIQDYYDIITREHHISKNRKRMSLTERAAQFAPFAALTGYEASLKEERRIVNKKVELSDEAQAKINQQIIELKKEPKPILITFFVKDQFKTGGEYFTKKLLVKKVDEFKQLIVFSNKSTIKFTDIFEIQITN